MTTFYFHIVCNESRFSGIGNTCCEAACNAIGSHRAAIMAAKTTQTHYTNQGELVGPNDTGVSNIISKNGIIIASVTRIG